MQTPFIFPFYIHLQLNQTKYFGWYFSKINYIDQKHFIERGEKIEPFHQDRLSQRRGKWNHCLNQTWLLVI